MSASSNPLSAPTAARKRRARKHVLNEYDYAILQLLQEDSNRPDTRISNLLAQRGLTLKSGSVGSHIAALRQNGYIRKTTAILNYAKFGAELLAFLTVQLLDKTKADTFVAAAVADKDVMEVHSILGEIDYILKVRVADIYEAQKISQRLQSSYARIVTHAVSDSPKDTTEIADFDRGRLTRPSPSP